MLAHGPTIQGLTPTDQAPTAGFRFIVVLTGSVFAAGPKAEMEAAVAEVATAFANADVAAISKA